MWLIKRKLFIYELMKLKFKNDSTEALINKAQNDDFEALEELIRREEKNIYATLYYMNARCDEISDLVQEILFKVAKNIKKLKNPKTFRAWLNQITIIQFYDTLRKKQRTPIKITLENDYEDKNKEFEIPDNSTSPHECILNDELDLVIKKSIDKLKEPFKMTIVMRELQGLSYDEIAQATNSSIGTVKSRIARARCKLQEYIKPYMC